MIATFFMVVVAALGEPAANVPLHIGIDTCFVHNERVDLSINGRAIDPAGKGFSIGTSGRADDLGHRTFTLNVAPGAYLYSVLAVSPETNVSCSSGQTYIMVLPDHPRDLRVSLTSGTPDTAPPLLVAGIKPPEVTVTMRTLLTPAACGKTLDSAQFGNSFQDATNESTAYYVEGVPDASEPADGTEQVLLQIQNPQWTGARWLLLKLPRPSMQFNGDPSAQRFDITPTVLQALQALPVNSLLCP